MLKKSFSYLFIVLITSSIFYIASDKINYKETYSLQNLIDNKLYVFSLKFLNNGVAYKTIIKQETINNLEIPAIAIDIREKDWKKIHKYYNEYLKFRNSKKLQKDNRWIKASLYYDKVKYQIKVKTHGKTPDGHYHKGQMSLTIKFKKGKSPFIQNRINLIIYNRIEQDSDILKVLTNKLDIYYQEQTLIKVSVNNGKHQLFFLEQRIDNDLMDNMNFKNAGIDSKIHEKSLIINYHNSLICTIDSLLNIKKKFITNSSLSQKRKLFYYNVNSTIVKSIPNEINKYVNIDYMAKFEAYRKILGLTNHGFSQGNFLAYPDTISEKLYLIAHRDNNYAPLFSNDFFEKQLINWDILVSDTYSHTNNLLFQNLIISDSIRLNSYKHIVKIYRDGISENLIKVDNYHRSFISTPLPMKLFYVKNKVVKNRFRPRNYSVNSIMDNLDIIMEELRASYPVINYHFIGSSLKMTLLPRSISGLSFSYLKLNADIKDSKKITIIINKNGQRIKEFSLIINSEKWNETINEYLNKITYFDNININGDIERSFYDIEILFPKDVDNLSFSSIKMYNKTIQEYILYENTACEQSPN